jgi:hypothetical protein
MKFSALCPTRKRPDNMSRLAQSFFEMSEHPEENEIVFYIDEDDTESITKAKELQTMYNIQYIVGERIVLSQMWNECYKVAKGEYFFHCGDDIIMRTNGWDTIVEDKFLEFNDRIAFVYVNDLNPGIPASFGTHGFLHKNWVETVGYFVPPYFSSDFNDTWLNEVSVALSRHFRVDVIAEHMHPGCGKAEWDQNHQERMARHHADQVGPLYASLAQERQNDVEKLKNFIESYV